MTAPQAEPVGPLVTFLVIGVQKGGTTALHHYLSEDANLALSQVKETHFFDDEGLDWSRPDYRRYHARFPDPQGRPCGEATPIYSYWPQSLERIAAYNPKMRLILLLRDPVERAWSHWRMEYARGAETRPFAWCIRQGRERLARGTPPGHHRVYSYVERGFYAAQMDRILALFPRDQLLVLRSDELRRDPDPLLSQVRGFLGAPPGPPAAPRLVHVGRKMDYGVGVTAADIDLLREVYAKDDRRLRDLAGISFGN